MSGTPGSNAAADSAAATAAALRGASLAFGRQKKAEAETNSRQLQQQQQQHLPPPSRPQRHSRLPSLSPSRDSTISDANVANALLAATSAAASSRDASVGSVGTRSGGRAGSSLLRPVSPGQQSATSRSRSRSRGRNTAASTITADFGSSPSSGIISPPPAIGRTRTGGSAGGSLMLASSPSPLHNPRSTSFLAATLAASQATSPGLTPSHTGRQGGGGGSISATNTGGPVPAHLSAALLASAAGDERRRVAAAAAAANLAATAAASRSTDNLARYGIHIGQQMPRGGNLSSSSLALSTSAAGEPDTSAIPATSSLVSMFEKEKNNFSNGGVTKDTNGKRSAKIGNNDSSPARPPKLKAFTPPRPLSPEPRAEVPAKTPTKPSTKPSTDPSTKPSITPVSANLLAREDTTQQKLQPKPQPKAEPKLEPQRTKPIPIPKPKPQLVTSRDKSSPLERLERLEMAPTGTPLLRQHRLPLRELNDDDDVMERPVPPKPRMRDASSTSSRSLLRDPVGGGPVRAASFASRGPAPLAPPRHAAAASPPRRPASTTSTVDGLASAIMAGSLAAARHPPSMQSAQLMLSSSSSLPTSRSRTPPAPPAARSTSPTKRTGMLQTLRRDRALSDDDDYDRDGKSSGNSHYRRSHYHRDGRLRQGKHHLSQATPAALVGGGRHKHKHHEGARRRWREAVTERQRRRYEAVWASNRGRRGIGGGGENDDDNDDTVPNVVVRDLWRRSRLPVDELAEVWDLVDETGTGRLGKAGFVVGLWLIDQRLRGRKIPARVSESVWSSARGMQGMQVTAKQRKR